MVGKKLSYLEPKGAYLVLKRQRVIEVGFTGRQSWICIEFEFQRLVGLARMLQDCSPFLSIQRQHLQQNTPNNRT